MTSLASDLDGFSRSLKERFQNCYHATPRVFIAPGRVNLIGEHTDYNDGFVMPAAIDRYTMVAVSESSNQVLSVSSDQYADTVEVPLNALKGAPRKHWSDYIRGVAALLQARGAVLSGANIVISSQVPLGAGLSSSASLEVSVALALATISGHRINDMDLARLCQTAEHEFAGTRCGIMDQFIVVFGQAGRALMLDCRSLESQSFVSPVELRIVICNSMVKHEHAAGEYNRRREDCELGVKVLRQYLPKIRALRDVTLSDLQAHQAQLPPQVYRRCRHVITENQRVLDAAAALQSGDLDAFSRLMHESHQSLRDDYEVSCRELDVLVELASHCKGVFGSRMTGGGFGGCTVNLVTTEQVDTFQSVVSQRYKQATGKDCEVYVCSAAQGARAL